MIQISDISALQIFTAFLIRPVFSFTNLFELHFFCELQFSVIKNLKLLIIFMFLTGCVQSVALLGPAVTVATTGSINHALLSGTINTGVKHQTGKDVSEHMVQSLNEPIDCSMTSSNELAEMFFDDYNNFDCYLEKN